MKSCDVVITWEEFDYNYIISLIQKKDKINFTSFDFDRKLNSLTIKALLCLCVTKEVSLYHYPALALASPYSFELFNLWILFVAKFDLTLVVSMAATREVHFVKFFVSQNSSKKFVRMCLYFFF